MKVIKNVDYRVINKIKKLNLCSCMMNLLKYFFIGFTEQ